jgi:purine-binding chemotaxis protein CheW
MKVICFWLAGQQFAADLAHVKETIVLRPITRVFLTPPWVAGIINLRGDVVAVIDLAAFLGLPSGRTSDDARILIGRTGGGKRAGLICDRLSEVRSVDDQALQPPPPTLTTEGAALARGVATLDSGEPVVVLDLERLFSSERLRQYRRGA